MGIRPEPDPKAPDVESLLARVRADGLRAVSRVAIPLGLFHVVVLLTVAASRGAISRGTWVTAAAEISIVVATVVAHWRKQRSDLVLVTGCGILAAMGLFGLGFTVGVGSAFVVLCVVATLLHRVGGAIAWAGCALILSGYCGWVELTRPTIGSDPGAVIVGTSLALRYSVAILALAGIATVVVGAVIRRLEQMGHDLAGALARAREEREERLAIERRLTRSRQLQSTGRLASRVAHELNNALTPIVAHAQWLEEQGALDATASRDALHTIASSAKRAIKLTREFQAFSPEGTQPRRPIAIDALIRGMSSNLEGVVRTTPFTLHLGATERNVAGDEELLRSVVLHLVANAAEATRGGGSIELTTTVVELAASGEGDDALPAGRYVELSVTDTGSGMPDEVIERIYEPFFTTKENRTGLGLASVYGAVQNHRGRIEVKSSVGKGTTFRVLLPVASDSVPTQLGAERAKRALVVDDEASVRGVIVRSLARAGYECGEAPNGRVAIEMLRGDPSKFGVVVLDCVMPEMSGEDVLVELRTFDRGLPVLMVSGHIESAQAEELTRDPRLAFLAKPFEPGALVEAVDAIRGTLAVGSAE